uniref:Acyl-coenzyme A thioesterase 13 n=1 Tax=Noccaea caerulescens TaxID=107243 RepID=A0A1J3GBZ9_NOCCA
MVDTSIFNTKLYLEELAKGNGPCEIEALIFQGLELIHVGKGILRCKVLVTDRVAGEDGTWQAGAIMAVMDAIGASAVYSAGDGLHSSVDLNSSFYSTAKIHEKVEVEARVEGTNGGLKSAVIEVRRESDAQIIATGRLWMAPLGLKLKDNGSNLSKL